MIDLSKLLKHQVEGHNFLEKNKYTILADKMGLGKSLTALSITNDAHKVGLLCPAYLRPNWRKELAKWLSDSSKFTVASYERVVKEGDLIFKDADVIIGDEAHYLKSIGSERTKAFHHYVKEYKPKKLTLLTGTPIKNRVPEIYSLLMLCSYGNDDTRKLLAPYSNYWQFSDHFAWGEEIQIGGHKTTKYSGHRNTEELKRIMATCYLRRLTMEEDLPEMREHNIYIEDIEADETMLKEIIGAIEAGKLSPHISSLKANSALMKAPHTVKYAKELEESGVENMVIFTDHIESSKAIAKGLGVTAVNSTLGIDARNIIVERFTSGLDRYLVATIGTLSTGVTLTNTSTMLFNDISWISGDIEQAKKRIHRIGQEKDCNYFYMLGGNIDEIILKTVNAKAKTIEAVV